MRDGLVRLDQNLSEIELDRHQMRLEGGKVLRREAGEQLVANGGLSRGGHGSLPLGARARSCLSAICARTSRQMIHVNASAVGLFGSTPESIEAVLHNQPSAKSPGRLTREEPPPGWRSCQPGPERIRLRGALETTMKALALIAAALVLAAPLPASAQGQSSAGGPIPVTVETFVRAETDLYISAVAVKEDGFGKFEHHREVSPVESQTIIRQNRDTLYSAIVLDLDAGPVTITLPDAGGRFMSMQLINQDMYSPPPIYTPGAHSITRQQAGTRYVLIGVRTLVDPANPKDVATVHALQDALKVDQPGGPGKLELPNWDKESQDKIRAALLELGKYSWSWASI
jgi:hypothetical protein